MHANPVRGKIIPGKQPDGTPYQVRVWGDEFYRVVESLDGYTLTRDPNTAFACYARLSDDGNDLVSTGVPVGDPRLKALNLTPHVRINASAAGAKARAARTDFERRGLEALPAEIRNKPAYAPTSGAVKGICLIVDFSDDPNTIDPNVISDFCNKPGYTGGGNNGSVRDFFHDISAGHLTYTNYVPPLYYRAQHPKTYYEDENVPWGPRARDLVLEALNDLKAHGFDFSQYDADHDGVIDAINCFYAGYCNNNWGMGLWPHSWTINFTSNGVRASRYQISDLGDNPLLGTYCHENGHLLWWWPDLYDYGVDGAMSAGVGAYCLMCYAASDTNPCEPCAYLKYINGWATTTVLTTPQTGLIAPVGTNVICKYPHPYLNNEYYLIENRQQSGRDAALPDAGLAIWHIDTNGDNENQDMTPWSHYLVTLVQADGRWDLEHSRYDGIWNDGDTTDLWKAPSYVNISPFTNPTTNWWAGGSSNLGIYDISASGPSMTFSYRYSDDCNHNGVPDDVDIANGTSIDCNQNGRLDECEPGVTPIFIGTALSQTACTGASATLVRTATGFEPLTYQWRKNGQPIIGATDASYTIGAATAADAGSYDVIASTACGQQATSPATTLQVNEPPAITQPPQSQHACVNSELELTSTATGTEPLTYHWTRNGQVILGASGPAVAVGSPALDQEEQYQVQVSNACGTAKSDAITIRAGYCEAPAVPALRAAPSGKLQAGKTRSPLDTGLEWTTADRARSYDVYFGTDPEPPFVGNTTTTKWALSPLAWDTTYYWRIVAKNEVDSTSGPLSSFTTELQPPAAMTLPTPADGATNVPVPVQLDWANAPRAAFYQVLLGTDPTKPLAFLGTATPSTWGPLDLAPGTKYYWQIVATNDAGQTPGPVWSFTTAAPITPAGLTAPTGPTGNESGLPAPSGPTGPSSSIEPNQPTVGNNDLLQGGISACPTTSAALLAFTLFGLWAARTPSRRQRRD